MYKNQIYDNSALLLSISTLSWSLSWLAKITLAAYHTPVGDGGRVIGFF